MLIRTFTGPSVTAYLPAVAALRIAVFRDYPYLYDGDPAYEASYLATYAKSAGSVFVLAFDGERVVGASTGIPLEDETDAIRAPFVARGIVPREVFYFGESVLLAEYRRRGIGHRFFDEREAWAVRLGGFSMTAFCAVVRDDDDPRRPPQYRSNEMFWIARGYTKQAGMHCRIDWKEIGAEVATGQQLAFWLRPLERAP